MAHVGTIGTYRTVGRAMPLSVWASTSARQVSRTFRKLMFTAPLSVWAAGPRLMTPLFKPSNLRMKMAFYVGGSAPLHSLSRSGRIAGMVQVDGAAQGGQRVVLLYRATLKIVDATVSQSNGRFEFTELYPDGQYAVVAFDDLIGAPQKNALISDYITPVPS